MIASIRAMRFAPVLLLLCLAACSGDPRAYGITGPGRPPQPPVQPDDATLTQPGLPNSGSAYGPSVNPSTGNGRFWGYD
jgi:hypothetical protein